GWVVEQGSAGARRVRRGSAHLGPEVIRIDVTYKAAYIYRMLGTSAPFASLTRLLSPAAGARVHPLSRHSGLSGSASSSDCWNHLGTPTGCWPVGGVKDSCFEARNTDQREPAGNPRGHSRGRPSC